MPLRMELLAVNVSASTDVVNERLASAVFRSSKATSDGELARVGTLPEGGLVESFGNTR